MSTHPDNDPNPIGRRAFLKAGAIGVGTLAAESFNDQRSARALNVTQNEAPRETGSTNKQSLIDVNVSLSQWPFRRVPGDETAGLVAKLKGQGVIEAWAGSFDALLHRDLAGVNQRLAEECASHGKGLLQPFGAVNPLLPDWEEDVRRCHETHHMKGIRLHPNYHGYTLDHENVGRLLELAARHKLVVQIPLTLEDERTHHPRMLTPHVDTKPLHGHLERFPNLQVVVLNAFRSLRGEPLNQLAKFPNVSFDIAMLEGVGGVETLLGSLRTDQVLFGSHAPFFYFEAAAFKLKESALTEAQTLAVTRENARRILIASANN